MPNYSEICNKIIQSMARSLLLLSVVLLFAALRTVGQVPDICLTKEEYRLYSLINEYRTKKGLEVIPVSKSLCYVAKIHARDLYINHPDTASCSLNSWSDKGLWTACCHSKQTPNPACIVNKPAEIAKYPGEGHELCYWDNEQLNPDTIFNYWISLDQARDLLMNKNKWSYFKWKAIGIGLYKGYACLWVGEAQDTLHEPALCPNTPGADDIVLPLKDFPKDVVTSPTGRYFLIFGSFNTLKEAVSLVDKYKKEGFYQAKIVVKEGTYRVALSDHATQQEALSAKKLLGNDYKEAWVTKF
jgi:hypothetical protein